MKLETSQGFGFRNTLFETRKRFGFGSTLNSLVKLFFKPNPKGFRVWFKGILKAGKGRFQTIFETS